MSMGDNSIYNTPDGITCCNAPPGLEEDFVTFQAKNFKDIIASMGVPAAILSDQPSMAAEIETSKRMAEATIARWQAEIDDRMLTGIMNWAMALGFRLYLTIDECEPKRRRRFLRNLYHSRMYRNSSRREKTRMRRFMLASEVAPY